MRRTLLVCPGRGSYTAQSLGHLHRHGGVCRELVAQADAAMVARGLTPVSALDDADRFDDEAMLRGAQAAALTFMSSVVDLHRLDRSGVQITCVVGNSMGWYTALYASGALPFESALELVLTMGGLQDQGSGSQVLYPTTDAQWRLDPERVQWVEEALERSGAQWSIRLGGIAVLAGADDQVASLMGPDGLPEIGGIGTTFPLHLRHHAAYHTPLMKRVSEIGQATLHHLPWAAPTVTLVDGQGAAWRPRVSPPAALRDYTLGAQVTDTYDFTASVRVALRGFAPDTVILLGPGQTLGSPVAQVLIAERWRGLHSRRVFQEQQATESPLLIALDRPEQARLVLAPGVEAA